MKKILIVLISILFYSTSLKATHLFGGDLLYSHVSGNTYKIKLVLYADCTSKYINTSGTIGASWNALYNANPFIRIFNNNTLDTIILLNKVGATVDVSQVPPSQLGQTQCDSQINPTPGVYMHTYENTVTLKSVSSNWRFLFTGHYLNGLTGRSLSLTNIVTGGAGSVMALVTTLNNLNGPNNAPIYNMVPTPYHLSRNFSKL